MVHVSKCPHPQGRSLPTTEFYIGDKPQIYCRGWLDHSIEEASRICQNCLDWMGGEQIRIDFEKYRKELEKNELGI